MNEQQALILLIASRMLVYPSETFFREKDDVLDVICHHLQSKEIRKKLEEAVKPFYKRSLQELQELYVSTFDLQEKNGLYLTYHEFGDSPKRGAAFIKLQKIINEAGFQRIDGELADYMPMLYEFLAVSPRSKDHERLQKRLAYATQRVFNHIPGDNPYANIFAVLMQTVFEKPSTEEIEKLEHEREQADLENLPYPIMY